ncbi:MAG: BspA family leucine-rich repeat surface protein, partial [Lachnospiraceae bacterium]|nr:BspA family leucine-rich repeat surface protein [Lachnospiraceae bacterium]
GYKWQSSLTDKIYAPSEIPSYKADTYELVELPKDYLLMKGTDFRSKIKDNIETYLFNRIVFTDETAPADESITIVDVSLNNNGSVVAWENWGTLYVSSQKSGQQIIAHEDCSYMFSGICDALTEIDFSYWLDTSKVKNMSHLLDSTFIGDRLNIEGTEYLNLYNLEDVSYMFSGIYDGYGGTNIYLDLSNWYTPNLKNMSYMFSYAFPNASSITINMSGWNTSNVTNMSNMFAISTYYASSITLTGLGTWSTNNVTNMRSMFNISADSLQSLSITGINRWNTSKVRDMSYMFYIYPGYTLSSVDIPDISGWDVSSVTSYSGFNSGVENYITAPNF